MEDIRPARGRAMEVRLRGTIPIQILVTHATTATATEEEKDKYYEEVQGTIKNSRYVDTNIRRRECKEFE